MTGIKKFAFIVGEKRELFFDVESEDSTTFTIREATWSLVLKDEEVDSGDCTIDDHTVSMTIQPESVGDYVLTCTCTIADLIIKEAVDIKVRIRR